MPVPCTEASLILKLAIKKRKIKKDIYGLYEVLAPGSSITKTDNCRTLIKGPVKAVVMNRKSDLTTKEERQKNIGTICSFKSKTDIRLISEDPINKDALYAQTNLE